MRVSFRSDISLCSVTLSPNIANGQSWTGDPRNGKPPLTPKRLRQRSVCIRRLFAMRCSSVKVLRRTRERISPLTPQTFSPRRTLFQGSCGCVHRITQRDSKKDPNRGGDLLSYHNGMNLTKHDIQTASVVGLVGLVGHFRPPPPLNRVLKSASTCRRCPSSSRCQNANSSAVSVSVSF